MSADPFRRAVYDDVGAVLDRSQQVSSHPKGVINDQGDFVSVRNLVFRTIRNNWLEGIKLNSTFASSGIGATLYLGFPMDST